MSANHVLRVLKAYPPFGPTIHVLVRHVPTGELTTARKRWEHHVRKLLLDDPAATGMKLPQSHRDMKANGRIGGKLYGFGRNRDEVSAD